ncbi:hypothetical protein COI52_28535, partial [Bacillus toyonensis]
MVSKKKNRNIQMLNCDQKKKGGNSLKIQEKEKESVLGLVGLVPKMEKESVLGLVGLVPKMEKESVLGLAG